MARNLLRVVSFVIFCTPHLAHAQQVEISRTNKTIAVTVTEMVRVEPEVAEVRVGYRNYARTQEAAFGENVRVANQITKALLDAGIPKDTIETQTVRLFQVTDEDLPLELREERQFMALQLWKIQVSVPEAQKVVDLAVAAGANEIEDVDWKVADPLALEVKANAVVLSKARALAEEIAKGLGVKVGELVYVSNRAPYQFERGVFAGVVGAEARAIARETMLKLFPAKVEREVTVHAVFAIE